MAYYITKHFGIEAEVDAVNSQSADAQLQWLLKDSSCFCAECRQRYYKDYSVRILSGYKPVSTCVSVRILQAVQGYENLSRLSSVRLV